MPLYAVGVPDDSKNYVIQKSDRTDVCMAIFKRKPTGDTEWYFCGFLSNEEYKLLNSTLSLGRTNNIEFSPISYIVQANQMGPIGH